MQSIKTYILESGNFKADRQFLIKTGTLNTEMHDKLKDNRVEHGIK